MLSWIESVLSFALVLIKLIALIYILIPFIIKCIPSVLRHAAFLNFLCGPLWYVKLNKPKDAWKLDRVKNYYVPGSVGKIGVWHFAPLTGEQESLDQALKVIVYCHGNAFHRGMGHRLDLYSLLQRNGFHVVAFDYRGFGDSEGSPSEKGVIHDAACVYKWTTQQISNDDCLVFMWGHSLGTTISTQALLQLQDEKYSKQPCGLILEAGFASINDALYKYPMSKWLLSIYPNWLIIGIIEDGLRKNDLSFKTASCLSMLHTHVLMFHAKDDRRVPFELGEQLFESAKQSKCIKSCHFVSFESDLHLGHNNCSSYSGFSEIIETFAANVGSLSLHGFKTTAY